MSEEFVVDAAARMESPSGESRQTEAHDEPGVTWMAVVLERKRRKTRLRGNDDNTILREIEAVMPQGVA